LLALGRQKLPLAVYLRRDGIAVALVFAGSDA